MSSHTWLNSSADAHFQAQQSEFWSYYPPLLLWILLHKLRTTSCVIDCTGSLKQCRWKCCTRKSLWVNSPFFPSGILVLALNATTLWIYCTVLRVDSFATWTCWISTVFRLAQIGRYEEEQISPLKLSAHDNQQLAVLVMKCIQVRDWAYWCLTCTQNLVDLFWASTTSTWMTFVQTMKQMKRNYTVAYAENVHFAFQTWQVISLCSQ